MAIRSFLAFELPPDIKSTVSRVSGEIKRSTLNVRWVNVKNIHLTMVFMGNIRSEDLPAIKDSIDKICRQYGPFDISLNGMGIFPNRRPRVLWLGLDGDLEMMSPFRDDLQGRLEPFGIKAEKRRFRPHLTLGRFRKPGRTDSQLGDLLEKYRDLTTRHCRLEELILFKSDLKPGGAVYTKLGSWPLSGSD